MTTPNDPSADRAQELACTLDYFTEQDLCVLCSISPSTAEAWRKRKTGPAYALAGNRILYPRAGVRQFLDDRVREQRSRLGKEFL